MAKYAPVKERRTKTGKVSQRNETKRMNVRQRRFVQEYMLDFNAQRAAARAGYSTNKGSLAGQAHVLMQHQAIKEAIKYRQDVAAEKFQLTEDRVIIELMRIAFADMRDYAQIRSGVVTITDTDQLTPEQAAAISEIEQKADGTLKVKLHSKQSALDSLAKHLGLFQSDKLEIDHRVSIGPAIQVNFVDPPKVVGESKVVDAEETESE